MEHSPSVIISTFYADRRPIVRVQYSSPNTESVEGTVRPRSGWLGAVPGLSSTRAGPG